MHCSISQETKNMTSSCKPTPTCIVFPVKKRGRTRIASDGDGLGARGAPFAGQQHGGGAAEDCLRLRRLWMWMRALGAQETQATLHGTRAATESFVIGRHARPFVIRQPLRQKFPMLGAIQTILAMACVLLRNRSGTISIPTVSRARCPGRVWNLLCGIQMQPGVNVAPNWRTCSQRHTTVGTCGSRQHVRG